MNVSVGFYDNGKSLIEPKVIIMTKKVITIGHYNGEKLSFAGK